MAVWSRWDRPGEGQLGPPIAPLRGLIYSEWKLSGAGAPRKFLIEPKFGSSRTQGTPPGAMAIRFHSLLFSAHY